MQGEQAQERPHGEGPQDDEKQLGGQVGAEHPEEQQGCDEKQFVGALQGEQQGSQPVPQIEGGIAGGILGSLQHGSQICDEQQPQGSHISEK